MSEIIQGPDENNPIVQGTDAWFESRLGKATASRIADIIAKTKTGESASRAKYRDELVAERISGRKMFSFTNDAMAYGTANEPLARQAYEAMTGNLVDEVAFIDHPTIAMSGASPDGVIGKGLIEIKVPQFNTQLALQRSRTVPKNYMTQMMWQMACTGAEWCDFFSFQPELPNGLNVFTTRVERDDKVILTLEKEVALFLEEVSEIEMDLRKLIA